MESVHPSNRSSHSASLSSKLLHQQFSTRCNLFVVQCLGSRFSRALFERAAKGKCETLRKREVAAAREGENAQLELGQSGAFFPCFFFLYLFAFSWILNQKFSAAQVVTLGDF